MKIGKPEQKVFRIEIKEVTKEGKTKTRSMSVYDTTMDELEGAVKNGIEAFNDNRMPENKRLEELHSIGENVMNLHDSFLELMNKPKAAVPDEFVDAWTYFKQGWQDEGARWVADILTQWAIEFDKMWAAFDDDDKDKEGGYYDIIDDFFKKKCKNITT